MNEDPDIYYTKLNWIAENGGMELVNVHPDYLNFENKHLLEEFQVRHYIELLYYVKLEFEWKYWNELPLEVAAYSKRTIKMDRTCECKIYL
ncbi:MAG: hypothetical protein KJN64_09790 [Ignavibacteria bacterium]|nr:hypothetical protein [Ignavibacteria bacterium]MBT8381211.1 hypothetical protein [Ignavibacteria bacterium]MBT8391666.1 hypothetical protein [Ignavibacteria bacterium]MBT8394858.1 hypothetical protein [Bacteroidia bacterium]NNL21154.1 hypothetical protein [Ignavibacteriaceae bacterium]